MKATRRHHRARLKVKRFKLTEKRNPWANFNPVWIETITPCSCPMCGNPRKHFGERTMAERRAADSFREQVQEIR